MTTKFTWAFLAFHYVALPLIGLAGGLLLGCWWRWSERRVRRHAARLRVDERRRRRAIQAAAKRDVE